MTQPLTHDERMRALIKDLLVGGITLPEAKKAFADKYVEEALASTKGNVTRASRMLGVHRNTLHRRGPSQRTLLRRLRQERAKEWAMRLARRRRR
jgi:DNA-binding NtrC family response regulator